MVRYLLIIALLANFTYANSEKYFIKFGSFKNLQALERAIERLPSNLRRHVAIVRSGSWFIPFAYYTSNKNALRSKVSGYRPYFKDAHIAHSSSMLQHPLVRNYAKKRSVQMTRPVRRKAPAYIRQTPSRYVPPVPRYNQNSILALPLAKTIPMDRAVNRAVVTQNFVTKKIVMNPVEEKDVFSSVKPKKYKHFSKEMLSGQSYYLAYKKTKVNPALLIKVTFENHRVNYQPIVGDMQMNNANYLVENHKLYMFADTFTQNGTFSKLDEPRDKYFVVSSWANGKKLNTLRYYYKMNDAKRYLGISTTDGLSEVLSEGEYDDSFLDD